jgi:HK97 family phage prohead protease
MEGLQVGERAYLSFAPEIRQSSDNKRTVIKIATDAVDRHGTIIEARGVDMDAYKRNPVVLFNHDYDRVIGRAANIQVRGGSLVAEIEWDEEDDFAAGIARKMRQGFLNAASVGFLVQSGQDDTERGAFVIDQSELVEFSIVAVPSNRDALVMSRDLKQQVQDIRAELEALRRSAETSIAAEPAPEESAAQAVADATAEAAAPAVPAEAAKQEPSGDATSPKPARAAGPADYAAMARALQPVVMQSVLRALGKA